MGSLAATATCTAVAWGLPAGQPCPEALCGGYASSRAQLTCATLLKAHNSSCPWVLPCSSAGLQLVRSLSSNCEVKQLCTSKLKCGPARWLPAADNSICGQKHLRLHLRLQLRLPLPLLLLASPAYPVCKTSTS